jgi:hypothetical protein
MLRLADESAHTLSGRPTPNHLGIEFRVHYSARDAPTYWPAARWPAIGHTTDRHAAVPMVASHRVLVGRRTAGSRFPQPVDVKTLAHGAHLHVP